MLNSVDLLENLNCILKSMSRQNCGKFLEFNIDLSFYGKLNIQEKQLPIFLVQNIPIKMKYVYIMVLTSPLWSTTMGILPLTGRNTMSIFRLFVLWAHMTVGQILFCTLIPYNFFFVSNSHNAENLILRLFTELSWPVNPAP